MNDKKVADGELNLVLINWQKLNVWICAVQCLFIFDLPKNVWICAVQCFFIFDLTKNVWICAVQCFLFCECF